MPSSIVVVVGTTADYIELIYDRYPERVLFITDFSERARAFEPAPGPEAEVLCSLTNFDEIVSFLEKHLADFNQEITGVACFDCESLKTAARLAARLNLPFSSAESIRTSRNKFISKSLWKKAGVTCPAAELVSSPDEIARLIEKTGSPVIIKPQTGSGSELVFLCRNIEEGRRAFGEAQGRLQIHPNVRMYAAEDASSPDQQARLALVAEEFIEGMEFSADIYVDNGGGEIIRLAQKIPAENQSPGTTLGYILPAELPSGLKREELREQFLAAAGALGIVRSLCMVDFIIRNDKAYILELTPRIGGDCLPFLIEKSCGLDMLGLALDFSEGKALQIPAPEEWKTLIGLRLLADREGVFDSLESRALLKNARIEEIYLKRQNGHKIIMPPVDYDSRVLGHIIFSPRDNSDAARECHEVLAAAPVLIK